MTSFRMRLLSIAALIISPMAAADAADGFKALITAQQGKAQLAEDESVATPVKQTVKKINPGKLPKGRVTGNTVSELSSQDCKNVGGKVITVADNRCGASGKYCRMPDTNAVCIDVLN